MKKAKHEREKFKIIEVYSVLVFIATLFMCIGYAEISGIALDISGTIETIAQKGVFISKISKASEIETESKVNYFIGTMFESKTVLGDTETSTETYEVTFYNNSKTEYVFIGALTDTTDGTLYDNENIEYTINGIEQYKTTIAPAQTLQFTITFKYKDGLNRTNKVLNSKINFRFKEMPKLVLSNDGQNYTLNDIYPDYTPKRYEFTVSNYIGEEINNIPISYSFDFTIDKPLSAKIYDENNNEITTNMSFEVNEQIKKDNKYILEIRWDDSNQEEGVEYDDSKYEDKQFSCQVKITAKTDDEKYLDFSIEKQFNVNINTGDYKDSYIISYVDITNFNYPTEIAPGEDLEITFIKEIPPDIEVTGAENYTYNKPTLVINNATTDIQIINKTGELIAYEYTDNYVFTGNNYINTETAIFSEANVRRNFVLSFDIVADDLTQSGYSTIIGALNEAGKPNYPGFLFRVGETKRITEFEFTANSTKGKAYFAQRETTSRVEIARIDDILYLRLNDGEYTQIQDYSAFTNYFDVPLTIGAGINSSGNPFRYYKGTLANIEFKFLNESASQKIPISTEANEDEN